MCQHFIIDYNHVYSWSWAPLTSADRSVLWRKIYSWSFLQSIVDQLCWLLKNGPSPAPFGLFSFFYTTPVLNTFILEGLKAKGDHADHLTTTNTAKALTWESSHTLWDKKTYVTCLDFGSTIADASISFWIFLTLWMSWNFESNFSSMLATNNLFKALVKYNTGSTSTGTVS